MKQARETGPELHRTLKLLKDLIFKCELLERKVDEIALKQSDGDLNKPEN
jgi:hypothetical protein